MERASHASSTERDRPTTTSFVAGAAAGLVGGLVASWLMVEFQHRAWPPPKGDDGEPSTSKLARRLAEPQSSAPLTDDDARTGGELIHYALGAGLGLAYGAAVSARPAVAAGAGVPFGVATEIVIDQTLVPALGLSNPFWKCPAEWHLRGLAAHVVFGLATELSRRFTLLLIDAATQAAFGRRQEAKQAHLPTLVERQHTET